MAYGFVTADSAAFATALADLRALQAADLPPPGSSPDVIRSADADLAAAEIALLDLHAPTFSAVIDKLMILWQPELWEGDDPETCHRQMVIGDLRRLAVSQA